MYANILNRFSKMCLKMWPVSFQILTIHYLFNFSKNEQPPVELPTTNVTSEKMVYAENLK